MHGGEKIEMVKYFTIVRYLTSSKTKKYNRRIMVKNVEKKIGLR